MSTVSTPIVVDTSLVTGVLVLPHWVQQMSAVSGAVAGILGAVLVIFRLIIAVKEYTKLEKDK
jgi:hypothetical protein